MLSAADFSPARARGRRRVIALAAASTTVAGLGVYLVDRSPAPPQPPTAMLQATSLAPHVVVFSVPLSNHSDSSSSRSGSSEGADKGSGKKDADAKDSVRSSSKGTGDSSRTGGAGGLAWPGSTTPSSGPNRAGQSGGGWSGISTGSPTAVGGSVGGAAAALPPGIRGSDPMSAPVTGPGGSTMQVPCTSRVSNPAALQQAVAAAGNSSAVICMHAPNTATAPAPTYSPATTGASPGEPSTATSPSAAGGSSQPTFPAPPAAIPPVSNPSQYAAPAAQSASPQPVRQAQMLMQIQCPPSISQGSVCFEATTSNGTAASLPPASSLGQLPVMPTPGSTGVACPTQRGVATSADGNNATGSRDSEHSSKKSENSGSKDFGGKGSDTALRSTVSSCGLLASSVDQRPDGGTSS